MVRGAAKGRSSCVCQGTLNGIPNAAWYVYQGTLNGTWRRRGSFKLCVPGYTEWYTER